MCGRNVGRVGTSNERPMLDQLGDEAVAVAFGCIRERNGAGETSTELSARVPANVLFV